MKVKQVPSDFVVEERATIEATDRGRYAVYRLHKRGIGTIEALRALRRTWRVPARAVGFGGLKDRHAVTRQVYTVHLPGRADPDWSALDAPGVRVLSAMRHARKLQRGALRGNAFVIVVRDVAGERAAADAAIAKIAREGVPNYFGEQRFGREGGNVDAALAMFAGRRVPREQQHPRDCG